MPQSAGTTSDLYMEGEQSNLGAPPSAPAPVPPPVQPVVQTQPVVTKGRMADETPDGRIRDTSTEALLPKNDLNFRNLTDESENSPKAAPVEEAHPEEPAADPDPTQKTAEAPPAEKLYAGKYKSPEELEKAYSEAQRKMHEANARAAELERKQQATPPPAPAPKTPAQLAAEEAEKQQFLEKFIKDPQGVINEFQQKSVQQTQVALAAQQVTNDWRKANPDLAEHEYFVAAEAQRLMQTDPDLAKDPSTLITKATENFRAITGKLRNEGAKEALTQETRVIPLLNNTSPSAPSEHPSSQKAPLNSDDAFAIHLRMLKEQEQKSHRGLRR